MHDVATTRSVVFKTLARFSGLIRLRLSAVALSESRVTRPGRPIATAKSTVWDKPSAVTRDGFRYSFSTLTGNCATSGFGEDPLGMLKGWPVWRFAAFRATGPLLLSPGCILIARWFHRF